MDEELSYYLAVMGVAVEKVEPEYMDGLCAVWLPTRRVVQMCADLCPGRKRGAESRMLTEVTNSIIG